MPAISPAFIRAIPKTDLHLHLDGSLRIDTLFELAKAAGVDVPGDTPEALRATVFKDKYASLEEYLRGFGLTTAAMQTEAGLFRVAYELMIDNAAEGVRYIEARFAPQLLMSDKLSFHQVMAAVDSGLRQARDELNARRTDGEPEYDYGLIVCAMRFFTPEFSPYYRQFAHQHRTLPALEIRRLAALELAHAATELRASSSIQIVGFDIAGAENGFPAADFAEAYDYYRTARAQHCNAPGKLATRSLAQLVTFDAFNNVELFLTQPLQIVAGSKAGTRWMSEDLYRRAASEQKDLRIVEGGTHMAMYDPPPLVEAALGKLVPFYRKHLST